MPGIKGCYLMWNMVDRREKSEVYDMWAKILDDLSVPVLQTQMPNLLLFSASFCLKKVICLKMKHIQFSKRAFWDTSFRCGA